MATKITKRYRPGKIAAGLSESYADADAQALATFFAQYPGAGFDPDAPDLDLTTGEDDDPEPDPPAPNAAKWYERSRWERKSRYHQQDSARRAAKRALAVVGEDGDEEDSDEAAAWNDYLSYANACGNDFDRGWRGNGSGDAA